MATPCARTSASIDFRLFGNVLEVTSAAVGGGAEARACRQAVRAVPPGCAEVGGVAWARVRARAATAEVLVHPLGRSRLNHALAEREGVRLM